MSVPDIIKEALDDWKCGWFFWSVTYYVSGVLVIALPAIAASNVLSDKARRIIAMAAAIVAGVVTWVQPGTRATAHEHAYICLKVARVAFANDEDALRKKFAVCADYLDYDYLDTAVPDN